jgi:hypothetical protein
LNPAWRRRTAAWSRWLHIYLSMSSFAVLFFFAITGVTLNHTDWFDGKQSVRQLKGTLNTAWVSGTEVQKLEIVEQLRKSHSIRNSITEFRIDPAQLSVSFKGPGYSADAFIDRKTGGYELTETSMGLVAVMNDLHKGRDTGKVWSKVIDISAILMVLVSLSGMVLIFFLHKRLVSGLLIALAGAILTYLLYHYWTP